MRILAIDFGTKRTGIAVTDELQIIASGLKTVATHELIDFVTQYCSQEKVATIVVGEPKKLDNSTADLEQHIKVFVKKITKKLTNINIVRYDERFTSKMAFQTMIDSGLGKKQRKNKALIDEISATIILQSYLTSK